MNDITITELLNKLSKENINIIDIRNNYNYQLGHIPNAKNINKILLISNPENYLDKSKKYYIYCESGQSSTKVVNELNKKGYSTINISGGYQNYKYK